MKQHKVKMHENILVEKLTQHRMNLREVIFWQGEWCEGGKRKERLLHLIS
jgi:hypothetical protein